MQYTRELVVVLSSVCIALVVYLAYPAADEFLQSVRAHAFRSPYWTFAPITPQEVSHEPARAVPILMYHGVVRSGEVGENTSYRNFVEHMEALKMSGYETISVAEYDEFREGRFVLPPKPIIITFDDGRKDSFYTTDAVFEKLGFKATLFVATVRANRNDPFYLSWDELRSAYASGRWEIEAHGRDSHEEVRANREGAEGTYLTTRRFSLETGIESVESYERRVDADYVHGNNDIFVNLGYSPRYFAVPLNDYGGDSTYEYEGAVAYNRVLTKDYYRLAFVQALRDAEGPRESFYNYHDSDPHQLRRLEVMNMTSDELLRALEHFAPRPPHFSYTGGALTPDLRSRVQLLYGNLHADTFSLSALDVNRSARALFGDWGWRNYEVEGTIKKDVTTTATILGHYRDEENYIALSWGTESLRLTERVEGKETELAFVRLPRSTELRVVLSVAHGLVSVRYGDEWLVRGAKTKSTNGAPGIAVWQKDAIGSLTITSLTVSPMDTVAVAPLVLEPGVVETESVTPQPVPEPRELPYLPTGMQPSDWEVLWGPVAFLDSSLQMNTASTSRGSGIYLRGSDGWSDYRIDTRLDWFRGRSLTFFVRYKDEKNYASCSFAPYGSGVSINTLTKGVMRSYGQNYTLGAPYYNAWINNKLGVRIQGKHIECLVNGAWVLRANLDEVPETGGVRLETWDKDQGVARIVIHELSVRPE